MPTYRYNRTCRLCGKPFVATRPGMWICSDPHFRKCEWCGEEFEVNDKFNYEKRTCSRKCANALGKKNREATTLARYGVKNAGYTEASRQKAIQSCLLKYGVEFPGQAEIQKEHSRATCMEKFGVPNAHQAAEVIEKTKTTCQERYGASCVLSKESSIRWKVIQGAVDKYGTPDPGNRPEALEKRKRTNLAKFGVEFPMQDPEFRAKVSQHIFEKYGVHWAPQIESAKEKARQNSLKKYGVEYLIQAPEVKQRISDISMQKFGVPWPCMSKQCVSAAGTRVSRFNKQLGAQFEAEGAVVEYEFGLGRYQYDLKIGNILIEVDPTYTHTTYVGVHSRFGAISSDYHATKSKVAEDAGYRCIHVFDWDSTDDIIKLVLSGDVVISAFAEMTEVICDLSKFSAAQFVDLGFHEVRRIPPIEHWSYQKKEITYPDNVEELIAKGWLPIYDCGYIVFKRS